MINLFDNLNFTGNKNFTLSSFQGKGNEAPVKELNKILSLLDFPEEKADSIKFPDNIVNSDNCFHFFIESLEKWTFDHNLIPETIMDLIDNHGFKLYYSQLEKQQKDSVKNSTLKDIILETKESVQWYENLIKELFFLLFQYIVYQESLYTSRRISRDGAFEAWQLNELEEEDTKYQIKLAKSAKCSPLPFFIPFSTNKKQTDSYFDTPLDVGVLVAIFHSKDSAKNLYFAIAHNQLHRDGNFSDPSDYFTGIQRPKFSRTKKSKKTEAAEASNLKEYLITDFKNFPLKENNRQVQDKTDDNVNNDSCILTAKKLADKFNSLKKDKKDKIYTPEMLLQFSYFIRERFFHLAFTDRIQKIEQGEKTNQKIEQGEKINQKIEQGEKLYDEVVEELLCSPFLIFRIKLLTLHAFYRKKIFSAKKNVVDFSEILETQKERDKEMEQMIDFLYKLHFITLPAFLLKGQCLYEQLKEIPAFSQNKFFEKASLWMKDLNYEATLKDSKVSNDTSHYISCFFDRMQRKVEVSEQGMTIEQEKYFKNLKKIKSQCSKAYIIMNFMEPRIY